jgi:hypothetical protein
MELPKRSSKHITETASFKIFNEKIPNNWVLREVTERDYGLDCYIELVNKNDYLTGHLVSIQIKGRNGVKWNKTNPNKFTLTGINISTTNYWCNFSVPVLLCLVDIKAREVFCLPVKTYIRRHFSKYADQKSFNYRFDKRLILDGSSGLSNLVHFYFRDLRLDRFENNAITFITHYEKYSEFINSNLNRDCFMGVETNRILYLKHVYNNLQFLCDYLGLAWEIESVESYEEKSQETFGASYDLYEQQMDEIVQKLEPKLSLLLLKLRDVVCAEESEYWLENNIQLFNLMLNVQEDGEMPYF